MRIAVLQAGTERKRPAFCLVLHQSNCMNCSKIEQASKLLNPEHTSTNATLNALVELRLF